MINWRWIALISLFAQPVMIGIMGLFDFQLMCWYALLIIHILFGVICMMNSFYHADEEFDDYYFIIDKLDGNAQKIKEIFLNV